MISKHLFEVESLTGSTSSSFAQNTIHDFQNTVLNSWWHRLRQRPQKVIVIVSKLLDTPSYLWRRV